MVLRHRRSTRRATSIPAQLARQVGARRLAAVPLREDGSSWAVATADHLVVVSQEHRPQEHPWAEVEHGSWDAEERTFTLRWTDIGREELVLHVPSGLRQEDRYTPVDPAPFARALRQRVEAAIIHSITAVLPSGRTASASVRRGGDGTLFSLTRPTQAQVEGTDDAAALRGLEQRARDGVGLPTQ